jgi:hypothetical protein
VRKKINDIRIRALHKDGGTDTLYPTLCKVTSEDFSGSLDNSLDNSHLNFEELTNLSRRNFLKIMFASGGVLLAGSFINKINKLNNIPLVNQSVSSNSGSMSLPVFSNVSNVDNLGSDYESFFKNFSIVKNKKEYILYNKEGDSILTIDRDE